MIKNVYKKKRLDPLKFINVETGELMDSEINNISNITVLDKSRIMIVSDDFASIDSKAYKYVESVLSFREMYYLNSMIHDIKTNFNLVYNSDLKRPYTVNELADKFGTQYNTLSRIFKRLRDLMIISIAPLDKNKVIVINPTLARKQKILDADTMSLFTDLTLLDPISKPTVNK